MCFGGLFVVDLQAGKASLAITTDSNLLRSKRGVMKQLGKVRSHKHGKACGGFLVGGFLLCPLRFCHRAYSFVHFNRRKS